MSELFGPSPEPSSLSCLWAQHDGRRLELIGRPEGHTRFLLVHAFGAHAGYYRWALERLPADIAACAVSLAGHGRSDPPPPDTPLSWWLDDIEAALAALGWDEAVLVGNSAGGGLVTYFAARRPERVRGVVLTAASPGGCAPSATDTNRNAVTQLYKATRPPLRRKLVDRLLARQLAWMPATRRAELAALTMGTHDHALESVSRVAWEANLDPILDSLAQTCPMLVIRGAHDPFADPGREPLAERAGVLSVLFEAAGHFPMVDDPGRFADALARFAEAIGTSRTRAVHAPR